MGKIIALWGCPGSGTSTTCVKLARAIYDRYAAKVLCVFGDAVTPYLPILFPLSREGELHSLGGLLADAEITPDSLLRYVVTANTARDMGFLGYRDGENRYTYAAYTAEKAADMLEIAATLADFVLVDVGWNLTEPLAQAALSKAAVIFQIASPGLLSLGFFASQLPLYEDPAFRLTEHKRVLNVCRPSCLPIEETKRVLGGVELVLPYSPQVERQSLEGRLLFTIGGGYGRAMRRLVETVVAG
mgnify:FL=1